MQLELQVDAHRLASREALDFARMGILPAGMYRNRTFAEVGVEQGRLAVQQDVLYDPQTAGGLLMACDPVDAEALFGALRAAVPSAQRVGACRPTEAGNASSCGESRKWETGACRISGRHLFCARTGRNP